MVTTPKRMPGSQHLEPLPALPRRLENKPKSSRSWVVVFCAVTLGLGAAATWFFAPASADHLTNAEVEQRAAAFAALPPLQVKTVPMAEVDARLAEMALAPVAQIELKQLLQKAQAQQDTAKRSPAPAPSPSAALATVPPLRLVELSLWDSQAPDGDVVRVVSAGYSRDVVLHKQPVMLAVPVQSAVPIQIIGVHDGGGGITLGVQGTAAPVMTPIMSEGQTIVLPIAP